MSSRINEVREIYDRLSVTLPQGLFEAKLERNLDSTKSTFETIFAEDHNRLQWLVKSKKKEKHIQLAKIEGNYLLVKGLPPIDESKLQDQRELVINSLSHWFMAVYALRMIFREIIDELRTARDHYNIYTSETDNTNDARASAFLKFTRNYQAVVGYSIAARELMEEYEYFLSFACHQLDESIPVSRGTLHSRNRPSDLLRAALELELRGNYGRHTSPPLIRSAVETTLTRMVLDPRGTKYEQAIVTPTLELKIGNLVNAAQKELGLNIPYSIDGISTLYEWGSQSVHTAKRMPTCEIWAAWIAADKIGGTKVPRVKVKRKEKDSDKKERERIIKAREKIIDRFVRQNKVVLIDGSSNRERREGEPRRRGRIISLLFTIKRTVGQRRRRQS
jgi:hypothetical protein